jgi:hypothetical protein
MNKLAVLTITLLIFSSAACDSGELKTESGSQPKSSASLAQSAMTERNSFQTSPEKEEISDSVKKLTGTYEFKAGSRSNEIKVLELGGGELKVSFLGNAEFDSQMGPMANSGEIAPTKVRLKGNKAILTPADSADCRITLVFNGRKLEVDQNENDCGLPGGVLADGVYHKTNSRPPVFDDESAQ